MILTKEQAKEFEEVCKPVMKFLCDNFNPHALVIIAPTDAEILSGSAKIFTEEFVRD